MTKPRTNCMAEITLLYQQHLQLLGQHEGLEKAQGMHKKCKK